MAVQMLRNREDALDAVQTTMAAVWRRRSRLDPKRDLRGWFYRVLRNRCIDMMRAGRLRKTATLEVEPAQPDMGGPAELASRGEELTRLRTELERLPDEMREIIMLRDYHDLSYADIARVLEVPAGTVMSRLHRARCALRDRMLAPGPLTPAAPPPSTGPAGARPTSGSAVARPPSAGSAGHAGVAADPAGGDRATAADGCRATAPKEP